MGRKLKPRRPDHDTATFSCSLSPTLGRVTLTLCIRITQLANWVQPFVSSVTVLDYWIERTPN
jgi:hypothetical protein